MTVTQVEAHLLIEKPLPVAMAVKPGSEAAIETKNDSEPEPGIDLSY
jgi:hypothetical protein